MADEFSCWVALVGLPSINSKQQTGPGKSCLCNRFIRSKEDDYSELHPSGISNQDFSGQVVNNDNFLYWGHVRRVVDNFTCGFKIVEQTQFYDDANFKPLGSAEPYLKRALKTRITTHGTKYQYIDYDNIADQESIEHLEKFPSEKTEKVIIGTFIFVFDVSREDMHFVDQYNMAETFIKQAKAPLVIALSKYDSFNCKHIEAIRNLTRKVPVVEVSAKENINVELVFEIAAKLAKHGPKSVAKMTVPTYEECFVNAQEKRQQISRLYNSLTEQSVVDKNVTWAEFRQFTKDNKNFQNYCELFGTRKARSNFDRHIRSLTIKWIEKRKNLYLKNLGTVYARFIDSLELSDITIAIQYIKNHHNFDEYFIELPEGTSWKMSEIFYSATESAKSRIRIPLDLLREPEALICFEQRMGKLRQEQEQVDLAEEFEHSLSHASNIIPGLSLEDVLSAVDGKFTKLDRQKSLSIYNDHQVVLSRQAERELEELLLENTALFREQLPGDVLKSDAISTLSSALQEDVRWRNLSCVSDKRNCILLQHLAVIVTGTRHNQELSSAQKSYKSMILEKTLGRKELSYSTKLSVEDYTLTVVVMSSDDSADTWGQYMEQEFSHINVDEFAYNVTVSLQNPEHIEILEDSPVHLIVGFYRTDDWESFRRITRSYDRLLNKTGYRGLPCILVYQPTDNPTVTSEEGSRFACRLNCDLLSEAMFKESLKTVLSSTISLLQHRAEFVDSPSASSFNKTVLNFTIRMMYDDDVCIKEITASLFKYQYSFVHPYEPGVYVIHTLLSGISVFVMVHLLHYLDKETYFEHACILLCKDSRRASLENARYYMTEHSSAKSLGLVVIETAKSLPYASHVMQTARGLEIKCITLEQEQGNRRVSLGQQTTEVDVLVRHVLQSGVQFVGCDLSCEEESCTDDEVYTSINDVSYSTKDSSISRKKRSNTLDRLMSPPPYNLHSSLPDRFKNMSVSCNELRDEVVVNNPWNSLPRSSKGSLDKSYDKSSDKVPPIYSTVTKSSRRCSMPFDGLNSPKSPPLPNRPPERHFSETSSEGLDTTEHLEKREKSGGMVASFPDSPFKSKRLKKKPSESEVEQKRLDKAKKRQEKESRRKRAKDRKLEKNRKLLASWDPKKKSDISNLKSFNPDSYHKSDESCYFGQALNFIAPWGGVPYYISTCIEYLECHDLTIEGLYRKEGNKLQINLMEKAFEIAFTGSGGSLSQFNILELDVSVHVVSSSIKKFFKRLPTPIIPHEFHDLLLAAVEIERLEDADNSDHVTRSISKVLDVINSFEKQNKITLAYIIRHLYRISEFQEFNKMSCANLAIIFWPTLLQPTQEVLINNEDRTKFSKMLEFLIANSDKLFGPELPDCPPPDDEDIYDAIFHTPTHPERTKTQAEYEYIKRPKTYFNQALRIGHVPSLVKQCLTFIENGKITTNLYVHTAREDLVDKFVSLYEAAYAVDEHRTLNFSKVLKKLTLTRSVTDDSISTSTTDENSVSSLSGDLSTCDSRFGLFEEETMDRTILGSVLKKYLSSLVVPLIPPEQHKQFLDILSVEPSERTEKMKECVNSLKQSHKILLSRILKHLSLMRDKGVLQIDEVFAPIIFYGSILPSPAQAPLSDQQQSGSVPITYTPSTERYEQALKILIANVNAITLEYGIPLYAPLYEIMEQGTEEPRHQYSSCIPGHQYYSVPQYTLPVLPEESRHYDSPDTTYYASISNTYEAEPRGRAPSDPFYAEPGRGRASSDHFYAEPHYSEADELSELYDDETNTPNANTYVEFMPLPVSDRHQGSDNLPNR